MSDMTTQMYDVVVIGGGAAGLSAALTLSRARRSVLVIDAGSPRNAPASHAHNYLGREGIAPGQLLAIGREEASGYGAEIVEGEAVAAEKLPGGAGFRSYGRTGSPSRRAVSSSRPGSSTNCRRSPASPSGGGGTCCTARTATAGRCGTCRSASWP